MNHKKLLISDFLYTFSTTKKKQDNSKMADYNVLLIRDSPRDEVTRVRSINFMTEADYYLALDSILCFLPR